MTTDHPPAQVSPAVQEPKYWLPCEVRPGMFPTERLVTVLDGSGRYRNLFVPEHRAREQSIEVRLIEEADGVALIRLPGELFDGWTLLSVERTRLEPAEPVQ